MTTLAKYHVCSHFVIGENTFKNTGLSCPASYRDFRETGPRGLFLESPGNLPGPRSIFVNVFSLNYTVNRDMILGQSFHRIIRF